MGPAARKTLWQVRARVFGDDAPSTRAAFGRYVTARGGTLTVVSSGAPAWVGCYRERGLVGFYNRSYRRAISRRVPPSSQLWAWQLP